MYGGLESTLSTYQIGQNGFIGYSTIIKGCKCDMVRDYADDETVNESDFLDTKSRNFRFEGNTKIKPFGIFFWW